MLQAPGAAGESLTRPQPGGRRVEMGARWVCESSGQGRSPGWGTAAAPLPFFVLHAPYTSLFSLLPAVTGVPSPRATDPPSHVRPLSFLSDLPLRSATHTARLPSTFRVHPPWGRRKMPFTHSFSMHYLPALPRFRLFAKSSPRELPRLPFWPQLDSRTASRPAAEGCRAGLRSGHLSLLSPARWPPGRGCGPVPAGGARPHAPPSPAAPCQGMSHFHPPRASA